MDFSYKWSIWTSWIIGFVVSTDFSVYMARIYITDSIINLKNMKIMMKGTQFLKGLPMNWGVEEIFLHGH